MIIITRKGVTDAEIDHIRERVESLGLRTHLSRGEERTIIGCVGDEDRLRAVPLRSIPGVEDVHEILKPYKLASRDFAAEGRSEVSVGDGAIGGTELLVIAGPCSVEGNEMLLSTAREVRARGARALRGGAFKPRTSPYSFRGLGTEGLEILSEVRSETGLPVVTEVMDTRQVELVASYADVLQVGARNMQNFALLTEVGRVQRPVLLKRGIRTFETATRNTFDLAAIPVLKRETHLPVVADPSHAGGSRPLVAPLAYAAVAAGADGLIVEVHPDPETATSDGEQSLDFPEFRAMMAGLAPVAEAVGRTLPSPAEEVRAQEAS